MVGKRFDYVEKDDVCFGELRDSVGERESCSVEPSTSSKMRDDILDGSLRNYKVALSMRASIRPLDHEDRDIDSSMHG